PGSSGRKNVRNISGNARMSLGKRSRPASFSDARGAGCFQPPGERKRRALDKCPRQHGAGERERECQRDIHQRRFDAVINDELLDGEGENIDAVGIVAKAIVGAYRSSEEISKKKYPVDERKDEDLAENEAAVEGCGDQAEQDTDRPAHRKSFAPDEVENPDHEGEGELGE